LVENIFSIDVEEIFHCEYARCIRDTNIPYRTPHNIPMILKFLREQNVTATFFVVGEIAEKFPEIVDLIEEEGHEVAFHGWSHLPLWELSPKLFRREVNMFKGLCSKCMGYRAPSFSLNNDTKWALKILREAGFKYDSSIFPAWTPLYGVWRAPIKPYIPSLNDISREDDNNYGVLEFPLAVLNFMGLKIPIAGGFWLRFWGIDLIRKGVRKMNEKGLPAVIFVHNWELDPNTPRLSLPFVKNFVTYYNLATVKKKVVLLLKEFTFTSFADYLRENVFK